MEKRNEIGNTFGYFLVESVVGKTSNGTTVYLCKCKCGNYKSINVNSLRSGNTLSCGCLKSEINSKKLTTHGLSKSTEYKSWTGIKERCYNKNNRRYGDWGGRGIKMCDRWFNSFENFLHDMGKKPTNHHSIERVDVDGDYCIENCKWATVAEQNDNKRNKITYNLNGHILTIKELANIHGIKERTLYQRLKTYNMPIEKAILKDTKTWKN